MANRAAAQKRIYEFCKMVDPSGYNESIYKKAFEKMSDKVFDAYMKALRDETAYLVLFSPLYGKAELSIERLLEVGEKLGLEFFERLLITGDRKLPDHMTPIKYLVVDLPYRRQSQTWAKKVSLPENNSVIDQLTYQPTGDSKGARISYPELQLLNAMGLDNTIDELIRIRGGDKNGFAAYNAMFARYGSANLKTLDQFSSGVESTKTLKAFLTSMHISNTI